MISIAESLRCLRNKRGFTQQQMADKIGKKNKHTYVKYETGERKPPPDVILSLSEALQCSLNEIYGQSDVTDEYKYQIPVIGTVEAGFDGGTDDDLGYVVYSTKTPLKESQRENLVGALVTGESMNVSIPNGSIVIVNTNNKMPVDNAIFVIRPTDGDGSCVIKRCRSENGRTMFVSESSDQKFAGQTIFDCQILGQIIKMEREF